MANYKLTDHYWETSGVFDIAEGKTQREVNADLKKYAGTVAEPNTATGDIATFDGVEGVPLKNLTVNIEPVQDLHGQANPYPAGGGKNLLGKPYITESGAKNGITWTVNSDGSITVSGTATSNSNFFLKSQASNFTLSAGTYTFSVKNCPTGIGFAAQFVDSGTEKVINKSNPTATFSSDVTLTDNNHNIYLSVANGVTISTVTIYPMIEASSAATDWAPYENICPITGWTGANVTRTGKNLLTSLPSPASLAWFCEPNGVLLKKGVTYCFSVPAAMVNGSYAIYAADKTTQLAYSSTVSQVVYTPTKDIVAFPRLYESTGVSQAAIDSAMLEIGNTRSDFEPAIAETYSITFPAGAGTVYGCTLDVTNGVLTVDRAMLDLTTVNFTTANTNRFYGEVSWLLPSGSQTVAPELVCNIYKTVAFNQVYNNLETGITTTASGSTNHYIWIRDNTVSTSSELMDKLAANEAKAVVLKTNGNTYQLTPTEVKALLGTNNVWADCGDVDVEYGAYLTVVENQLGEKIPKVAVAPIEKTTTASKAYSVNEMFFMGDKLYIATASIASGATFTVGTNCDETTLGEQIAALLNA